MKVLSGLGKSRRRGRGVEGSSQGDRTGFPNDCGPNSQGPSVQAPASSLWSLRPPDFAAGAQSISIWTWQPGRIPAASPESSCSGQRQRAKRPRSRTEAARGGRSLVWTGREGFERGIILRVNHRLAGPQWRNRRSGGGMLRFQFGALGFLTLGSVGRLASSTSCGWCSFSRRQLSTFGARRTCASKTEEGGLGWEGVGGGGVCRDLTGDFSNFFFLSLLTLEKSCPAVFSSLPMRRVT